MSVVERANLVIYRLGKRGLEVFLVKNKQSEEAAEWQLPADSLTQSHQAQTLIDSDCAFQLDPVQQEESRSALNHALAVEDNLPEVPSLKSLLREDWDVVKSHVQEIVDSEEGTYFAVKEAFKKIMPSQYAFLKELKDIVRDRNSVRDL